MADMAEIVLGMAMPHSAMLGRPGELWHEDGERDRANRSLVYHNRAWEFPELVEERKSGNFAQLMTVPERQARKARCDDALAQMRAAFAAADVDLVVLIGKDQKEMFTEISPCFAIYSGAQIHNGPPQKPVFSPDHEVTYHGHPELAQHLLTALAQQGFDLADVIKWPGNSWMGGKPIVPHAFSFVYRQIMEDAPPPSVPVFMNTFFAPTQPSMARSIAFGEALTKAIQDWQVDARVAIIASGGLSHFVCDEEFDQQIIGYLRVGDLAALEAVENAAYQSGNSEIKLFVPVLVAMQAIGARMTLVDYVPCYRTEAGTGEGMGFMYWSNA